MASAPARPYLDRGPAVLGLPHPISERSELQHDQSAEHRIVLDDEYGFAAAEQDGGRLGLAHGAVGNPVYRRSDATSEGLRGRSAALLRAARSSPSSATLMMRAKSALR
jgi:hypothetical protein